ncbi:MAG TPA: YlbF family regulator [Bacillales bacterium]|nr:YlbF family regulator [Bacillales bacterium]
MLATSERIEILDQVDYLVNMILNSDIAAQYRICLYNLNSNKESQRKIRQFVQLKDLYEDVQRFGKYHPDYKRVMKEVRVAKREMDLDPNVAEFKIAENDLQGLLDEISVLIGGAVSENIKVPTGNPFFETSHSCSSGGCGHH